MSEIKSIKAVFICAGIVEPMNSLSGDKENEVAEPAKQKGVFLCSVSSGSEVEINDSFATPGSKSRFAELNISVDPNTDADKFFKPGEVYYVEIRKEKFSNAQRIGEIKTHESEEFTEFEDILRKKLEQTIEENKSL